MKKTTRIFLLFSFLISFSQLLRASHGLPLVNLNYTVGATGITINASSDAATCGDGPFWMQTKVSCNPISFSNVPAEACIKTFLQNWTAPGVNYNSFPWYNSLLNVPNYNMLAGWPDNCLLEPYNTTFVPFADLCPGKVYYFSCREIVTGGFGAPGPFGPVVSFTVPGTPGIEVPGFISSNPATSPSNPSCGGGVILTFIPPQGCGPVKSVIPGCATCDSIVWRSPSGVIAVNTLTVLVTPSVTTTYTLSFDTCSASAKVGCGLPYNPVITVFVANTNAVFAGPPTLCSGSSANFIAVSPALNDLWSVSPTTSVTPSVGTGPSFSPVFDDPGVYVVTHQSINGSCSASYSQTITVTPGITSALATAGGGCSGTSAFGTATISVSTSTVGLTYSWTPGGNTTNVQTNIPFNTTYSVTMSNGGCIVTKTVQITNNPAPTVTSFSVTPPLCNGQSNGVVAVNLTGGNSPFSFTWSPTISQTTQTVTGVGVGTYTVQVLDNTGCTTSSVVTVSQPAVLTTTASVSSTICAGTSATISAASTGGTPAYSYTWNIASLVGPGPFVVSPATYTQYTYTVTDINGCIQTQTTSVNVNPALTVSATAVAICIGDSTTLVATITSAGNGGPYTYLWSNGATSPTILVYASGATNYSVTVSDGCSVPSSTTIFTVTTNPTPVVNIVADSLVGNAPLTVNFDDLGSGGTTFSWNFGNGSTSNTQHPPSQTYQNGGTYQVIYTSTSSSGCPASDTLSIHVIDLLPEIIVPNVFTPNGDKANDLFAVKGTNITSYECLVFNRWGKLVFSSSDVNIAWDGKINGSSADEGTYFYIIKASGVVGEEIKNQGYVTLFR